MLEHARLLLHNIESSEMLVQLDLDAKRNKLLLISTMISVVSLAMTFCSVVAGFFGTVVCAIPLTVIGMNVTNGKETSRYWFTSVIVITVVLASLLAWGILGYLSKRKLFDQ